MARTKASVGSKVSSGKSTKARAVAAPPPPSSPAVGGGTGSGSSRNSHTGGNSVCPRETPGWQKPITRFFGMTETKTKPDQSDEGAGSSSEVPKKRRANIIESDDETETQKPQSSTKDTLNTTLNDTIELEPLNGEDSHKIAEYFPSKTEKTEKNNVSKVTKKGGKGVKKSKVVDEKIVESDKENVLNNSVSNSEEVKGKRAIEETMNVNDDLEISSNKRIKV